MLYFASIEMEFNCFYNSIILFDDNTLHWILLSRVVLELGIHMIIYRYAYG